MGSRYRCVEIIKPDSREDQIIKRSTLSAVNSIFDPIGLLTPFTVKVKILLRKIWTYEPLIDWDDKLPEHMEQV